MPRSAILTGRIQQRDRAHLRGRLDRARARPHDAADARTELARWIAAHVATAALEPIETLELTAFVRDTAAVALPPEERLRQLAIALEPELTWREEQPRAWLAHDRIYQAALALNPRDAWVHASRALTAYEHVEAMWRSGDPRAAWTESPVRRRIMRVAYGALNEALALAPDDAALARQMGDALYHDPDRAPAEALAWYDRALALDASECWAALYRAHCLHDMARWRDAAAAYDAVNPACFDGPRAWRYEHLLEQRADCWLRAGETARAQAEFEALLDRWERAPQLAAEAWGYHLADAARGPLRDALFERTRRLCEREERARREGRAAPGRFGLGLAMLSAPPV